MTVTITLHLAGRSLGSVRISSLEHSASHDRQLNPPKSDFTSAKRDREHIDTQPETLTRVLWTFGYHSRAMRVCHLLVIYPNQGWTRVQATCELERPLWVGGWRREAASGPSCTKSSGDEAHGSQEVATMSSEQQLEERFIQKLLSLKYEYRPDIRDRAALEANFREKFQELNRVKLTDDEFQRLLDEIVTPDVFTVGPHAPHDRTASPATTARR